tara:strand:+ start:1820 stop:2353 length:534 start_codon:yes stop_codon:yes gene_type:complete
MATPIETTIEDGNLYITTGSVSGNTITHDANKAVEIFAAKIEYDYQNTSPVRPIALSGGKVGLQDPIAMNTGVKMVVEVATGQGILIDDGDSTAVQKRDNLLTMAKLHKELVVVWGTTQSGQTLWKRDNDNKRYGAGITKIKFTQTAGKYGETTGDTTGERKIDVQIQLTRAKDVSE